jgi:hypothetical protein
VNYKTFHQKLRRSKGSASGYTCACGRPAIHWAYRHNAPEKEITDPDGSVWVNDFDCYVPMCRSCHYKMDLGLSVRRAEAFASAREKAHLPEAIAKMRARLLGQKRTPEQRERMRWTPERRAEHSEKIRRAHEEGRYR